MSHYNSSKRKSVYNPKSKDAFKLSRSKIDLFIECSRCFYLDRKLCVSRPQGFPFNLNSAVDALLKKEFDIHRKSETPHPLMQTYGIDAVPFSHPDMDVWRENFTGVQHLHEKTNLLVFGAVDDIWMNRNGELAVVDYKATSKTTEVNLDAEWQDGYKRQMEVYQWLLRQNGFEVSATGYFVYANGKRDLEAFDGRLEFDVKIIPYTGDTGWIEKTLILIKQCLDDERVPIASSNCEYCAYRKAAGEALKTAMIKEKEEVKEPIILANVKKRIKKIRTTISEDQQPLF
jgi:CRISPR/Cas system-associated exonuclease Cas4 (RecB family)